MPSTDALHKQTVGDTLAQVDALVEAGCLIQAIDLATKANYVSRNSELEARLIFLRCEAAESMDTTAASRQWRPEADDLFGTVDGLAEIRPEAMTAEAIASGIMHHGSLLIRGLIPAMRVQQLVNDIDRSLMAYEQWESGTDAAGLIPWLLPFTSSDDRLKRLGITRSWTRMGGSGLTAESPRTLFDLLSAFEDTGLTAVISEYLSERPAISVFKSVMRRVAPVARDAGWHQDGAFLDVGRGLRTVNAWLALSHCGSDTDAPGIEMAAGRLDKILPTGTGGTYFDWSVGPETVRNLGAAHPVIVPRFAPGDVLLFDEFNLHRTATGAGLSKPRYALETWFFAPSHYPPHHYPLLV